MAYSEYELQYNPPYNDGPVNHTSDNLHRQLDEAKETIKKLRRACEPLLYIYAQEITATDGEYFEGPVLNKRQVRAIQQAMSESVKAEAEAANPEGKSKCER